MAGYVPGDGVCAAEVVGVSHVAQVKPTTGPGYGPHFQLDARSKMKAVSMFCLVGRTAKRTVRALKTSGCP